MHKHLPTFGRFALIAVLLSGLALASCSPTRVHKKPPHKKGDGIVGKLLHRKEMPCGC